MSPLYDPTVTTVDGSTGAIDLTGTYAQVVAAPTGVSVTDSAAIQAAHDALPVTGGILRLQNGTYDITAGITLSRPVALEGAGAPGQVFHPGGPTQLVCTSPTATPITVTSPAVTLRNFALVNTSSTTPTAGAGILVSPGGGSGMRYVDIGVRGFYVDIDHSSGEEWYMDRCFIYSPIKYGLKIRNLENYDAGDFGIVNCSFYAGPNPGSVQPDAMIRHESGGGMRLVGNKFNGYDGIRPKIGYEFAVEDGAATGVLVITGNSFEACDDATIKIHQAGPLYTGESGVFVITGNEISPNLGNGYGVYVCPEINTGFQYMTISGNLIYGTIPVHLANIHDVCVSGNRFVPYGNLVELAGTTSNIDTSGQYPTLASGVSQSNLKVIQDSTSSYLYLGNAAPGLPTPDSAQDGHIRRAGNAYYYCTNPGSGYRWQLLVQDLNVSNGQVEILRSSRTDNSAPASIGYDGFGNMTVTPASADNDLVLTHGGVKLNGGPRITGGSGAPSINATAGDVYIRSDTPTVANQRLYVCTATGSPGIWVGVL
jgi:hypothetical protein